MEMFFVPVLVESGHSYLRQIRALHPAGSAGAKRAAASVDAMARQAVVPLDQVASANQLVLAWHLEMGVAASAAGIRITRGDHRLRPEMSLPMGVGLVRRPSLSAVADRAAELRRVVADRRVGTGRRMPADALFPWGHADVAGHATIRDAELRHDDLTQTHLQRASIGLDRGLDLPPLPQEVLLHSRRDQQAQRAETRPEKQMFVLVHCHQCLGQSAGDQ